MRKERKIINTNIRLNLCDEWTEKNINRTPEQL